MDSAQNNLRVLVTGGGTGGHVYPALAVVEALQADPSVTEILYVGNPDKIEAWLTSERQIPFQPLVFSGMPRRPGLALIQWGFQLLAARKQAAQILKDFQPSLVFGTGGYVTGPVMMSARKLNIPYVVHEPDAHPGLVNRQSAKGAAAVTAAFKEARHILENDNFHVTGNPLRGAIGQVSKADALTALNLSWPPDGKVMVVTGGSQGAKTLNDAVVEALPYLIGDVGLHIIHQTGDKSFKETMAAIPQEYQDHPNYLIKPYYANMPTVLGAADFALCRAGSMTLSEMVQCGLPTILVPYPYAAADHQTKNAQAMVSAGAALMIEDSYCHNLSLCEAVQELLLKEPGKLDEMRQVALALAHPNATAEIVAVLKSVIKN
ncbi:MAG: undecaprenyldiphospho-muramoylpentapeptide beta-N-acetylglucosaminyltransferase [Vampirovibrio sp.]|nr:undecaprenyldiphospho-muramoylpentapeptide beta-N-acetylglucosaminyltransferase [Vampirovibrio sp.]